MVSSRILSIALIHPVVNGESLTWPSRQHSLQYPGWLSCEWKVSYTVWGKFLSRGLVPSVVNGKCLTRSEANSYPGAQFTQLRMESVWHGLRQIPIQGPSSLSCEWKVSDSLRQIPIPGPSSLSCEWKVSDTVWGKFLSRGLVHSVVNGKCLTWSQANFYPGA